MMNFSSDTKVYLSLGTTDMRKAINGLSVIVSEQMQLDIFSSNLFVFCNWAQTILKILYWDKNGFCLWQKHLEKDRFKWPKTSDDAMNITNRELSWLIGRKHDKKLADESGYRLPKGSILLQDIGFQGFSAGNVLILQPAKKPRGKNLTLEQKVVNRGISKIRIEHVISGIKRYKIVKEQCRNWLKGFTDLVMAIACGLHNLRLRFRPWKVVSIQDM